MFIPLFYPAQPQLRNVYNEGSRTISERGVVYADTAINPNPQIGGTGVTKLTSAGTTGVFTVSAAGLTHNKSYAFAAFATNAAGTSYTTVSNFDTAIDLPTVSNPTDTEITTSSATLGGNVTDDGGGPIMERGVVYADSGINSNPQIGGTGVTKLTSNGTTGMFTVNAASLIPGKSYAFAAFASNAAGTAYTAVIPFTAVIAPLDTIGVFRSSNHTYYLSNSNTTPAVDITVTVGDANTAPVVGDWDGDGFDTVGVFNRQLGIFLLYDSNVQGAALSQAFVFGNPNDVPLSGRWVTALQNDPVGLAGHAHDGVSVFRPSNGLIYLISAWPQPPSINVFADYTIVLGNPGWMGLAGRWSPGLLDTAAVYDPSQPHFYMTNASCNGTAPGPEVRCLQFSNNDTFFGIINETPFKGDWIGLGQDGIGVFNPTNGAVSLKNTFPIGFKTVSQADSVIAFGAPGDIPVAGHWKQPGAAPGSPSNIVVQPVSTPSGDGRFD